MNYLALRIAAAALTPLLVLQPQVAHCAPAPVSVTTTQLDHISIQSVGKGPTTVLIPGLASPRAVWDWVVPELAKTHRVLVVQVNGFGSDDPRANLKPGILDGIVSEVDGYLTSNKLGKATVIGHSMGGLVAMMLAHAHPGDVDKAMIVDSLPYFAVLMAPPGIDPTPAMVAPQAAMMRDGVVANYGKPLSDEAVAAQTRGLALKPESIVKLTAWARTADARVTGQAMYEDLTTDLRPVLASISTPLTLLYPWNAGGPTKPMADAFYRQQYAAAPNMKLYRYRRCGAYGDARPA